MDSTEVCTWPLAPQVMGKLTKATLLRISGQLTYHPDTKMAFPSFLSR